VIRAAIRNSGAARFSERGHDPGEAGENEGPGMGGRALLLFDGANGSLDSAVGAAGNLVDAGEPDAASEVPHESPVAAAPSTRAASPEASVPPSQPAEPQPTIARRININAATEGELQLLPGIGPARARAILEDRRVNGRFRSVDELDRVRGIGAGIIAGLREFARAG